MVIAQIGFGRSVFILSPGYDEKVATTNPIAWQQMLESRKNRGKVFATFDDILNSAIVKGPDQMTSPYGNLYPYPHPIGNPRTFLYTIRSVLGFPCPTNIYAGCPSWAFCLAIAALPTAWVAGCRVVTALTRKVPV
jgi:hypothetical protein